MTTLLPELEAIQVIAEATAHLSPSARLRVAAWFDEFARQAAGVADAGVAPAEGAALSDDEEFSDEAAAFATDEGDPSPAAPTYDTFAALYEAVAPKTGAQKATVAGYWLEVHEGRQSWKASEVNKMLKEIGVKVSSMSIVLTNAVKAADPMIAQLGRLGDGERSRKTFCLKEKGVAFVEERLEA